MSTTFTNFNEFTRTFESYLIKKSAVEAIEVVRKSFAKHNKAIAREIAEDIIGRYNIQVVHLVRATNLNPEIRIRYIPKTKQELGVRQVDTKVSKKIGKKNSQLTKKK